ncbi:MAG: hypothetical protein EBY66_03750 [Candidatus Fonsibacter lacus]|nr:hypothetical protein [Candidatus Fonsibacter lacus]
MDAGRQRAVARRQEEEANALSQAVRAASARAVRNGMVDPRLLGEELAQSGYAYAIPSAQEKLFATQKAAGEATKAASEGEQAQIKAIGDKMQSFRQRLPVNNPRLLPAWVEAVYADPDLGPFMSQFGTKEEVIAGIPQDAAGVAQWMEGASMAADEVMKRRVPSAESMLQYTQPLSSTVEAQKTRIARAGAPSTKIQNWVPASETAQKEFIEEFRDTYKQLKTAPTDIANLRRAAELSKTEGRKYMGTGGEAFLSAAKFLKNRLGVDVDEKAIASAEEARTVLFQNVLNNLRKLDAQPSQQQQLIMQQALGSLDTDPDALPRVVQVYEDVIRGRVEQHNREFAEMKANPNLANAFPYSLEIKLPERAAAPPPSGNTGQIVNVRTAEEARKLAPGTRFRTPDGRVKVR